MYTRLHKRIVHTVEFTITRQSLPFVEVDKKSRLSFSFFQCHLIESHEVKKKFEKILSNPGLYSDVSSAVSRTWLQNFVSKTLKIKNKKNKDLAAEKRIFQLVLFSFLCVCFCLLLSVRHLSELCAQRSFTFWSSIFEGMKTLIGLNYASRSLTCMNVDLLMVTHTRVK